MSYYNKFSNQPKRMTKAKADKLYRRSQKKFRSYNRRGGLFGIAFKRGIIRF